MSQRTVRAALAALAFLSLASVASAGPATVGRKVPPFELESLTGDPISSTDFEGKPLYANVFATWCGPCRSEMPLISRTLPHYRGRVAFLAVDAQESSSVIAPYLKSVGVKARVAIDGGQFVATFGASSIPESIFIDRRGIVRAIVHGPIDVVTLKKDLALIES